MKSSAARAIEELRPMDSAAHRRLYLPVVRAMPRKAPPLAPVQNDIVFYSPKGQTRDSGSVRATTLSMDRLSRQALAEGAAAYPQSITDEHASARPTVRGDCLPGGKNEQRPCPWVNCAWHLAVDIDEDTGSIKVPRPDRETWGAPRTCALDVADEGRHTLEEVGELLNVTRERLRQVEGKALAKVRAEFVRQGMRVEELDAVVAGMEKW